MVRYGRRSLQDPIGTPSRERLIANERIVEPLMTEGRGLAVARGEAHVVAEREQLLADRSHELAQVAVGVFPGADGMTKQDIPHEGVPPPRVKVRDVTLGMSRAMQDLQGFPAEADFVAVLQPPIGGEIVRRQAIAPSLLGQAPHKVFVATVWSFEAGPGGCREARRSAGM